MKHFLFNLIKSTAKATQNAGGAYLFLTPYHSEPNLAKNAYSLCLTYSLLLSIFRNCFGFWFAFWFGFWFSFQSRNSITQA